MSDPSQVASYLWRRVPNGAFDLSTAESLTLHGDAWPNSAATRTFRVTVTLNDGSEITADQTITFTDPSPSPNPPPAPEPPPSAAPPPLDPCTESLGTLAGSVSRQGSWDADCFSEQQTEFGVRYARRYAFALSGWADAEIELRSSVDPMLYLLDGSSEVVAYSDRIVPGNHNAQIAPRLAPGDYVVEATTYENRRTGGFTLDIGASATVNPNRPPAIGGPEPVTLSVSENAPGGLAVGAPLAATDADGDALTWRLSGGGSAHFAIDGGTGQVRTAAGQSLDHEAEPSHAFTATVSDGRGGSDSVAVNVAVADMDEPPPTLAAPDARALGETSLRVAWAAPGSAGRPPVTGYEVRYRASGAPSWTHQGSTGTATAKDIAGLVEGTSYEVQVRASNDEGTGGWSESGTGIPQATGLSPIDDAEVLSRAQEYVGTSATVEQFVQSLPDEHRYRAVLVTTSRAGDADFVSHHHPRAIAYGSAHEIFSWGTNPQSPRHDRVEFIFRRTGGWAAGVIDFQETPPLIGRTDACRSCHLESEKPLWAEYPQWPGMNTDPGYYEIKAAEFARLAPIKGTGKGISGGYRMGLEMTSTLAIRNGEVLVERTKAEKGEAFDEWALEMLCSNDFSEVNIQLAFPLDEWPHTMGGENGELVPVNPNINDMNDMIELHPGYHSSNADGDYVIVVLLLNHFYETRPAVQGLYAATNNRDMIRTTGELYALWYPPGTATAEQELAARVKVLTELRGMEWIDFRYDHFVETGKHLEKDMVVGAGHTYVMVPKTCAVLAP